MPLVTLLVRQLLLGAAYTAGCLIAEAVLREVFNGD